MKIEKDLYIVVKEENDKTVYLTMDYTSDEDIHVATGYAFTENIHTATKAINKTTAECLIDAYKEAKWWNKEISTEEYKDKNCNFGMKIMPLKITYEW